MKCLKWLKSAAPGLRLFNGSLTRFEKKYFLAYIELKGTYNMIQKRVKGSTSNIEDGFCKCTLTVSVPNVKGIMTVTLTVRLTDLQRENDIKKLSVTCRFAITLAVVCF